MNAPDILVDRAQMLFNEGFNCAQSAFSALCDHWGLPHRPSVATDFGGGIGRTGAACGILTGSLMALGLLAGNDDPKDTETKERVSRLSREFILIFNKQKEAINCNDLLGLDISAPDGHRLAAERKTKQNICMPLMKGTMLLMDEFAEKEGLV